LHGQDAIPHLKNSNDVGWVTVGATSQAVLTKAGNRTFRATSITTYLTKGGTLEKAVNVANHASTRTKQLYHQHSDAVALDEIERIVI
jgi:hypothetical protein